MVELIPVEDEQAGLLEVYKQIKIEMTSSQNLLLVDVKLLNTPIRCPQIGC